MFGCPKGISQLNKFHVLMAFEQTKSEKENSVFDLENTL